MLHSVLQRGSNVVDNTVATDDITEIPATAAAAVASVAVAVAAAVVVVVVPPADNVAAAIVTPAAAEANTVEDAASSAPVVAASDDDAGAEQSTDISQAAAEEAKKDMTETGKEIAQSPQEPPVEVADKANAAPDDNDNDNATERPIAEELGTSPKNEESPPRKKKNKIVGKKKSKRKLPPAPKPLDVVGFADSIDVFQGARNCLNQRVPWFQENPMANFEVKHIETPTDWDWDDGKEIHAVFPPWKLDNGRLLGTRQIPKCFLLDSETLAQKLLVVNWWRSMSKDQQTEVVAKENMHRFYRAPMRSNSPYKFWHDGPDTFGARIVRADNEGETAMEKSEGGGAAGSIATNRNKPREGAPIVFRRHNEPTPGFRLARHCQDLCDRFNLSAAHLYCASIEPNAKCAVENCNYPAFRQNRAFCCVHKQNWWPRKILEHNQKRRGHLLLGVEYAVRPGKEDIPSNKTKVRPVACGCSNLTCEGIGWSADMVRVPKSYDLPESILPNAHRDKDRPLRLAPWHFAPEFRMQLPDGTWKMTLEGNTKVDTFPEPDYSPSDFLKEPGMIQYQKLKSPHLFPGWVHVLRAVEEGPLTLEELQRLELIEQRDALLQRLLRQSVKHHELSEDHHKAESKLEEMKKTHVHKRNAKRGVYNSKKQPKENKKRQQIGDDSSPSKKRRTVRFRPVNGLGTDEEARGAQQHLHRQAETGAAVTGMAQIQHQGHHPRHPPHPNAHVAQHFRDERAALHQGAQAIQYLQHQATTAMHHQPHLPLHIVQQQQQQAAHNSAFYPVVGDPNVLANNAARTQPPATTDLTGIRGRWGYPGFR